MKYHIIFLICICANNLLAQSPYEKSLSAYRSLEYDSALHYIERAIAGYRSQQQTDSLVMAQVQKANMLWELKGFTPGLAAIETALQWAQKLPITHFARVAALDKKAQILVHQQENAAAKAVFLQALKHIDPAAQPNGIYSSLYKNYSWFLLNLQDFDPALKYAVKALQISEALYGKDARELLGVYQSLMLISQDAGNYAQAENYGLELLRLANLNLSANHPNKGLVHNDLGSLYEIMHRSDEALFHRQEMVRIIQQDYAKHKNPQLLAIAYNNMGSFYQNIGEVQLSLDYYQKAKNLHELNYGRESAGIVRPITHLANMKAAVGAFNEADSLFSSAYQIQQKLAPEDWMNLAYVESQYGDLFLQKKELKRAESFYLKALQNNRKAGIINSGNVPQTRTTLAETYVQQGRLTEALPILQDVLQGYRKKYPAGNIVIAGQINKISAAYLFHKDYNNALKYSDSTFLELLQLPVLPSDNWVDQLPYNHYIIKYLQNRAEILKGLSAWKPLVELVAEYGGFLSKSLPALRTQGSIMQLASHHKAIYNSAIDACWALYKSDKNVQHLHKAFEFSERSKGLLLRLSANTMLADAARADGSEETQADLNWRKKISSLNAQYLDENRQNDSLLSALSATLEGYRKFQDSLLKTGSVSSRLKYNLNPATIQEIQSFLKKEDQAMLQYAVTDQFIYLFAINARQFHVHRLSNTINADVEQLKELHGLKPGVFSASAHRLYKQLIKPVEHTFLSRELLIIPDGELFRLNMELLIADNSAADFSSMDYLLKKYTIHYQLSATNALLMKNLAVNKEKKALLLTPVFTDEMKKAYREAVLDSSTIDAYYLSLLRQPFALQAAKQIGKHLKHDLFAESAALESVLKSNAAAYSLLHLGTHAEVNHASPLLSRFFMAKPIPADSTGKDDGYLHAYEIYGLPLQAELAVLTACETGSGNWVGGEGVVSLAHSFMYAGCPSVVMSLWKIDEKASAQIITNFYEELAKGANKSEALRTAKLKHIEADEALSHPYFWAGMNLMGNNAPITSNYFWWWLAGGILLITGVGTLLKKKSR